MGNRTRAGAAQAKQALQVMLWDQYQIRIPEWLRDGADEDDLQHIHGIVEAAWQKTHTAHPVTPGIPVEVVRPEIRTVQDHPGYTG